MKKSLVFLSAILCFVLIFGWWGTGLAKASEAKLLAIAAETQGSCEEGFSLDAGTNSCRPTNFGIFAECVQPDSDGTGYTARFGYQWNGNKKTNLTESKLSGPKVDKDPPSSFDPGRHTFEVHSETNGELTWQIKIGNKTGIATVDQGYYFQCGGGEEECGECDGKVTTLTLKYLGSSAALVKVDQKKEGTIFEGTVQPGGDFLISGQDSQGTLGTEITIYVDGQENTKIHTSCSQPINIGTKSGVFEVLAGASRNGGPLCQGDNNHDCDEDEYWDDDGDKCQAYDFSLFIECIYPDEDGDGYWARYGYKWDGQQNINLNESKFTGPATSSDPITSFEPGRHTFDVHAESNGNLVWTAKVKDKTKTTTSNENYQTICDDNPNPDIPEISLPVIFGITGGGVVVGFLAGYFVGRTTKKREQEGDTHTDQQ